MKKTLKHTLLSIAIALLSYFVIVMIIFLIKYPITHPNSPDWAETWVAGVTAHTSDIETIINELKADYSDRGNQLDAHAIKNNGGTRRMYFIDFEKNEIMTYAEDGFFLVPIENDIDSDSIDSLRGVFSDSPVAIELSESYVRILDNIRYIYSPTGSLPTYVLQKGDRKNYEIYKINDNWYYAIPVTAWW
jgi:hypothetical protein